MFDSTQWDRFLTILQDNTTTHSFNTWFSRIEPIDWDGSKLEIGVPNKYVLQNLERYYTPILQKAAREALLPDAAADSIPPVIVTKVKGDLYRQLQQDITQKKTSFGRLAFSPPDTTRSDKNDTPRARSDTPNRDAGTGSGGEYSLESFSAGDANAMALNACTAVLNDIRGPYNPLVFHGMTGTGKTHLIRGLCDAIQFKYHDLRIRYLSTEAFVNAFTGAIRSKSLDAYRDRFRNLNVLALDDLHFLRGKMKSQEEFLHTIEHIHARGGLVIIGSALHPNAIGMDKTIADKLSGGLVVELKQPDRKALHEMIRRMARRRTITITDAVVRLLCDDPGMSVRELVGTFNRLAIRAQDDTRTITEQAVREELQRDVIPSPAQAPRDPDGVLNFIADHFSLTVRALRSGKRGRRLALPRKIAAWILKTRCGLSLAEIGRRMGGRSHATIHYLIKSLEDTMQHDATLNREVRRIRSSI